MVTCFNSSLSPPYIRSFGISTVAITVSEEDDGYALLEKAGRKRGFLISGGEVDTERMSRILLDEFRGGKLGRFTLELPPEGESV